MVHGRLILKVCFRKETLFQFNGGFELGFCLLFTVQALMGIKAALRDPHGVLGIGMEILLIHVAGQWSLVLQRVPVSSYCKIKLRSVLFNCYLL